MPLLEIPQAMVKVDISERFWTRYFTRVSKCKFKVWSNVFRRKILFARKNYSSCLYHHAINKYLIFLYCDCYGELREVPSYWNKFIIEMQHDEKYEDRDKKPETGKSASNQRNRYKLSRQMNNRQCLHRWRN